MRTTPAALCCSLCCILLGAMTLRGQESAPASSATSGTYLRIANLLPVTFKPLTVSRGAETVVAGARPGFFASYTELPMGGGKRFTVSSEGQRLGDFQLAGASSLSFFTMVALMQNGRPTFVCLQDNAPPPPPPQGDPNPPPPPPKRFRGYFGGFDFPYRVEAGKLGSWNVSGNGVVIDLPFDGPMPATVSVQYTSRDGDRVLIHYPLAFGDSPKNSAFVSQRGKKRPRVQCAPDNILPAEEDVPALDGAPTDQ